MKALLEFAKRKPILFLILLAALLRIGAALMIDLRPGLFAEHVQTVADGEFARMAQGLLKTGDLTYFVVDGKLTPSAYQPPLYPLLLAGVYSVTPSMDAAYVVVQMLGILLSIWIVTLTYRLAQVFIEDRFALLAGAIVAVWPAFIYMPMIAHPIVILTPILLWTCLCVTRLVDGESDKLGLWALLGLAFGLCMLQRSEMLLAALLVWAILFVKLRREALPGLIVCLAVFCACEAPWVLRNAHSLGKPVLTTTASFNLFRGDGPDATGGSYQWSGLIVEDTPETKAAAAAIPWSKDYEIERDGVYSAALKGYLSQDPLKPVKLLPEKAFFFLTTDFTHPKGKNPIYWVPWGIFLPAMFYGGVKLWANRRLSWVLYFWVAFYLAIVMLFFALPRYRMTVEPICAIFAAAGIAAYRERREPNRTQP